MRRYLGADCAVAAGEVTCSMAVPIVIPMSLRLFNSTLNFTAQDGTAVNANGTGPTFTAAASDVQFQFAVAGSKFNGIF